MTNIITEEINEITDEDKIFTIFYFNDNTIIENKYVIWFFNNLEIRVDKISEIILHNINPAMDTNSLKNIVKNISSISLNKGDKNFPVLKMSSEDLDEHKILNSDDKILLCLESFTTLDPSNNVLITKDIEINKIGTCSLNYPEDSYKVYRYPVIINEIKYKTYFDKKNVKDIIDRNKLDKEVIDRITKIKKLLSNYNSEEKEQIKTILEEMNTTLLKEMVEKQQKEIEEKIAILKKLKLSNDDCPIKNKYDCEIVFNVYNKIIDAEILYITKYYFVEVWRARLNIVKEAIKNLLENDTIKILLESKYNLFIKSKRHDIRNKLTVKSQDNSISNFWLDTDELQKIYEYIKKILKNKF